MNERKRALRELATKFLTLLVFLGIVFGVVFGITPMRNQDMMPKISAGDLMVYERLGNSWISGDVVVWKKEGKIYTGRIVAVPGDQVKITGEESLEINGSVVAESNIFYKTPAYEGAVTYPLTLSSGEYFVLGDFREGAKDSRYFGPIERKEIKGKVLVVLRRKEI
ncbi:signal peptidase I [Ruminococcus sp. AF14-10]|nr:signal peptidase I [Ruminococcus sp. AF14-10]